MIRLLFMHRQIKTNIYVEKNLVKKKKPNSTIPLQAPIHQLYHPHYFQQLKKIRSKQR